MRTSDDVHDAGAENVWREEKRAALHAEMFVILRYCLEDENGTAMLRKKSTYRCC
jgi:hypothetical protein